MTAEIYVIVMIVVCLGSLMASLVVNRNQVKEELAAAIKQDITSKQMREAEQAADYVAAALLMPFESVYTYLEENCFRTASPRKRIKMTKKLCKTYGVDEIVALRRIREVYMVKES